MPAAISPPTVEAKNMNNTMAPVPPSGDKKRKIVCFSGK
jgi:hypothetical protein